jgi:hypothetical protein
MINMLEDFVYLLDALVLTVLIIVYLELTSKRNAYVGFEKSDYLNYFMVDGVADEVQINQAIDYISRIGGGATNLTEREYSINSPIEVKSYVTLQGSQFTTKDEET